MANIKIGETIIENVNITDSGNILGINYATDMTIAELSNLYDAQTSPEISFLNEDGTTAAIYKNRDITYLSIGMVDGKRTVDIVLQVSSATLDEATTLNEKIELQATEISTLKESLSATDARLTDAEAKLPETETKLAEAESRVVELESENKLLTAQIQALSDRNDFVEDCIAEMATVVYA